MKPKEFFDHTSILLDEMFAFVNDKDRSHCNKYWEQAHILYNEVNRVRRLLKEHPELNK